MIDSENTKQALYKIMKTRLKIALKAGFDFEACAIEYAILEDRTASILRDCNLIRTEKKRGINDRINLIEKRLAEGNTLLERYIDISMLNEILAWTRKRNKLVHDVMNLPYDPVEFHSIAEEGRALVDRTVNVARNIKRARKI